jgi:hypothetical protein
MSGVYNAAVSEDEDPTVERVDWVDEERDEDGPSRELRRLVLRARIRWPVTLAVTLALTGVAVGVVARRERVYTSRVVFRVLQSEIDVRSTARTNDRLRDYVADVIFSRPHLSTVIAEHGLYPQLRGRDPTRAIEQLRDDLELQVWRTDVEQRHPEARPTRSTRVTVAYHGRDRDQVFAVAQHLGRLITDQWEKRAMGRWELTEPGHVEHEGLSRDALYALVALVAFVLSLPLAAILVGAADARIYDLADVKRLGMPTIGAVRSFEGDNAGALAERLARDEPGDGRHGRMGPS